MFEFFIALFGGLYYGGKFAKEKSDMRAYNKRRKSWQDTLADIETQCAATFEAERRVREFIASGEHYEEICEWFADDFAYVLGSNWKDKLRIPKPSVPMSELYAHNSTPFMMPSSHVMWVYHLLLAKKGKIAHTNILRGFPIGGSDIKDMNIKFAQCIEKHLLEAGVRGVRLALSLHNYGLNGLRDPLNPIDVCGGDIQIESICNYPTHRLWDDYALE